MVNVDSRNAVRARPENAWTQVVRDLLLGPPTGDEARCHVSIVRCFGEPNPEHERRSSNVTVTVDERLANRLIAVTWSDSTRCSYRGQLWRYAIAKQVGRCALSGQPIRRGDAVFRPRTRSRNIPLNCDAMILAACIDTAGGGSVKRT